ncbi:chemotaxis protein CheB [Deferrisoma camini]|uniref:chemotaxis protein CheB n=1 Tax=Deferrisoma camini TaxID=1035120 RepID=UPI00046CE823|nr:chemotaxis protein CheB [Deferrisoma camini]
MRKARILVVDDSPYVRRFLREALEPEPWVAAVEGATNGQTALAKALHAPPDLVTLDLHMPVMDGFTFLRLFRARFRAPVLVVSSHADLENVERAMELGANGFISKPEDPYRNLDAIVEEVRAKARNALELRVPRAEDGGAGRGRHPPPRDFPVIAIGASSGGPPGLQYLLSALPPTPLAAVLIAQHMPAGFTEAFAKRLDRVLPFPVREGREGAAVGPGEVWIAPGGRHLTVDPGGRLRLEDGAQSLYSPSVDRLFETAAAAFGARLTAVVLTGMGRDGAAGVEAVKAAGGAVIAESENTAVIHGMPRQAAATGCVDEVLSLPEISLRLLELARGEPLTGSTALG